MSGLASPEEEPLFEGIMEKLLFVEILEQTLVPFVHKILPMSHRFNDPKHTSNYAKDWMESNKINWWKTPAESPDMNPIENLWHEMKEFVRREVKPTTKDELVDGLNNFWRTVDATKCNKYINHFKKVMPKVVELNGSATGY